jgi:hypothetical protein
MRHRVDKTMAGTVAIASAWAPAQSRETRTTQPSRNCRAIWHLTTNGHAAHRWSRRRLRPPNAPWREPGQRGERPPLSRLTLTGAHARGSSASTGSRSPLCPGACPSPERGRGQTSASRCASGWPSRWAFSGCPQRRKGSAHSAARWRGFGLDDASVQPGSALT